MGELAVYSETARDRLENTPVKKEIDGREDSFMKAQILWQKIGNICTLFLLNKKEKMAVEFVIPNDEVAHWLQHPFAHPDANFDGDIPSPGWNDQPWIEADEQT